MRSLKILVEKGFLGRWVTHDGWGGKYYYCVGECESSIFLWYKLGDLGLKECVWIYPKISSFIKLSKFNDGNIEEEYRSWINVDTFKNLEYDDDDDELSNNLFWIK